MAEVELNGGRPAKVGQAVRRSVREARSSREVPPLFEAYAGIAERLADLADAAWRASDSRLLVSSLRELRAVLAKLRLVEVVEPEAPADEPVDAGAGAVVVDDVDRELAELLGSGPTLRDSSDS